MQNKIENCDEYTQIKQNKRKLIYSHAHVNGTDHHISGSCSDLISPVRRTTNSIRPRKTLRYQNILAPI